MSSSRMTQRIPIRVTSTTADRTTKNRSTLNIFGERMVMKQRGRNDATTSSVTGEGTAARADDPSVAYDAVRDGEGDALHTSS